nr:hypothetical protein GCM10025699_26880 [Microbacterium flavescens]
MSRRSTDLPRSTTWRHSQPTRRRPWLRGARRPEQPRGVLLDAIHEARRDCAGIVINPGGLTHTSVVLRDALAGVALPVAEVHISDVKAREPFRHHSYVADVAVVHVSGEGVAGYAAAIDRLIAVITGQAEG